MKFHYYPETDSLYIDLSAKVGVDSNEVAPGVVLDFDANGQLVGIDIDNASKIVDLSRLSSKGLQFDDLEISSITAEEAKSDNSVQQREVATRERTLSENGDAIKGIEAILNVYLDGFRSAGAFQQTPDNSLEMVWRLLLAKSFNSLRLSYDLVQMGYYVQALSLIRMVDEDWLVCMDSFIRPETVESLLSDKGSWPKFGDMANRLPEKLKMAWKGVIGESEGSYGFLSTFVHPRNRSLASMINSEDNRLRVGPDYDKGLFLVSSYYLVTAAIRMTEFLGRTSDSTWVTSELALRQMAANDLARKIGDEVTSLAIRITDNSK